MTDDRSQMSDVRGQMSDVRCQSSEVKDQMTLFNYFVPNTLCLMPCTACRSGLGSYFVALFVVKKSIQIYSLSCNDFAFNVFFPF